MKKLFLIISILLSVASFSQGVTIVDFLNTNGVASYPTHKEKIEDSEMATMNDGIDTDQIVAGQGRQQETKNARNHAPIVP